MYICLFVRVVDWVKQDTLQATEMTPDHNVKTTSNQRRLTTTQVLMYLVPVSLLNNPKTPTFSVIAVLGGEVSFRQASTDIVGPRGALVWLLCFGSASSAPLGRS